MPLLDAQVTLGTGPHGGAVVAVQAIAPGMPVLKITGSPGNTPSKYTIQIGAQVHVLPDSQLWRWINHSCAPNCHIDFCTWSCVTSRAIQRDEELTFNYLTTEWDMAEPFVCRCGAANCYGCIAGFRYLAPARQVSLAPHCAPHLLSLWRADALARLQTTGRPAGHGP